MFWCGAHLSNLALGSSTLSLRLFGEVSIHKVSELEVKRGLSAASDAGSLSIER